MEFQTVGDSPLSEQLPVFVRDYILQGMLISDQLSIAGSDMTPVAGLQKGNSVSLLLECSTEKDFFTSFDKLSAGGYPEYPPACTEEGVLFGGLTDKFGYHWLLRYQQPDR